MRALVTGAAGFIGSTLSESLVASGTEVVGIDSLSDYYDRALKRRNVQALADEGVHLIEADLNDVALDPILDDIDVVYHLAGQPGVRASWGSTFDSYVNANVNATQRLLEAVKSRPRPPRLVYASSSSIYGDAESYPTSEDLLPRPRSPYGVTKLAGEHLCRLYSSNFAIETVSLRFFTVYGPRQRPDMAFTRFLRAAVAGRPITLYGTGEQIRDFTYVTDIVDALILAGQTGTPQGAVYNVSGGGSHSVNEVLDLLAALVDDELLIERHEAARGDVTRTSADITAIRADLGWQPKVPLTAGLQAQLEWVLSTTPSDETVRGLR